MCIKCTTLYNSCARAHAHTMKDERNTFMKWQKKIEKPEARDGIRQTGQDLYTNEKKLFYVSATENIGFWNEKHTVRTAETYVLPKKNIKTKETSWNLTPSVFQNWSAWQKNETTYTS